ncbi:MaoC/PaaZ C-terminal domain-containing protein [Dietzia sp.]|uniref:MaoC/PaaZ C-terminal domain-containing protein n=1 Tax=Dietzia sp. TaxID=1871616 RepID=UPI002FDA71BF
MTAPTGEFAPRTIELTRDDLIAYARASGDSNPIHLDDEAARALGLEGVIAHGMLTWARVLAEVGDWAGSQDAIVRSDVRFARPVPVPADEPAVIELSARVKDPDPATGLVTLMLNAQVDGAKIYGKAAVTVRPRGDSDAGSSEENQA